MRTSQLVIGFEMPVTATEIAKILEKHYGPIDIGLGIFENGLQTNCLYVHNKRKKNVK
jgi:uncharacterized protein YejL (UPF0352 family)